MYAYLHTTIKIQRKKRILQRLLADMCIVLLCTSAGCGMMRKVERERNEGSQNTLRSGYTDSLNIQQRHTEGRFKLQQSDSSVAAYVLEIWPKGQFSIRKGEGFVGEAEKVQLRGRNLAVLKSVLAGDWTGTETKFEQRKHAEQTSNSSSSSQLIVRKHPAWKWALILLGVAIGLDIVYYLYKKRRRLTAEPPSL
jgi:hypothetical protein